MEPQQREEALRLGLARAAPRRPPGRARGRRPRGRGRPRRRRPATRCASLYITETTVSTMSRRSARSAGSGIRSGIPAAPILRLARTIRCATVGSALSVARAICAVVRPHTARRVRASCASGESAGWQHPNSSGSRSSASASPAAIGSTTSGSASSASLSRYRFSRRSRSRALCRAAWVSQPPGFGGTPRTRHSRSASSTASATASSASRGCRARRSARRRSAPDSSRTHVGEEAIGCRGPAGSGPGSPVAAASGALTARTVAVVDDHRPDLDGDAGQLEHRPGLDDRDRRVEVGRRRHAETADDLLRLGERAVGDDRASRRRA